MKMPEREGALAEKSVTLQCDVWIEGAYKYQLYSLETVVLYKAVHSCWWTEWGKYESVQACTFCTLTDIPIIFGPRGHLAAKKAALKGVARRSLWGR